MRSSPKTLPIVPRQTQRAMQHIVEVTTNARAAHPGGLGGQVQRLANHSRLPEQLAPGCRAAFPQDRFESRQHAEAEHAVGGDVLLAGQRPRKIAQVPPSQPPERHRGRQVRQDFPIGNAAKGVPQGFLVRRRAQPEVHAGLQSRDPMHE